MYEFEPASPTYAISDTFVEHRLHGRDRTRADLPGGYRLTLRTRERHGQLEAALAAPSPTGPARISVHTPTPVTSRILDAVTRYAPALPDARDARPPLEAVARLLTTGAPFQRLDEPGLFVRFGHAEAWLEGRRLSVTLGGPWDAPSTARLAAAVLRELTEAGDRVLSPYGVYALRGVRPFRLPGGKSSPSVWRMAGRPSSKTKPHASQAPGKYTVPGWLDEGPLRPGRKVFVRLATEKATGRKGVIKHVSGNNAKVRGRFAAEARFMYEASGRSGILPAWDIDRRNGDEPRWYAMPRAELLDDALGPQATLLDVVTRITTLAGTLAGLAEEETFHRDIKPDNLFWYDGGPVLADFGIAAFADDRPGLTADREKLGPANFIAPEMRDRRAEDEDPGRRADVYSLAKTLFVLAQPNLGRFPPDGPHRADAEEFMMELYDGSPGLSSLRHVLEAATQFDPRNRLSMAGFRDELQVWSQRHGRDPDRFPARNSPRRVRAGDAFWDAYTAIQRRDTQATQETMQPSIRRLAEILTGDSASFTLDPADPGSLIEDHLLADHGFPRTHSTGSVPEGGMVVGATGTYDERRIVLVAVLNGAVCYVAESHALDPGTDNVWSLEHHWAPTPWRRPRMPSADDDLTTMTEQIVQWIRSVQDSTPPLPAPGRRRRPRPLSSSHEKDS